MRVPPASQIESPEQGLDEYAAISTFHEQSFATQSGEDALLQQPLPWSSQVMLVNEPGTPQQAGGGFPVPPDALMTSHLHSEGHSATCGMIRA
jgi:hypothetical protein